MTKRDTDIIAWLNMLQANGLNPATWVQATLLADAAGQSIDIGGIYVPLQKKRTSTIGLFGDDTEPKQETVEYGWQVRGLDRTYVPGSIFTISVSRPIISYLFEDILGGRRMKSRYIKAILRKYIRKLSQPPNELPKTQYVEDIFILYERFFPKFDAKKYGKNSPQTDRGNKINGKPVSKEHPKRELDMGESKITQTEPDGPPTKEQSRNNPLLGYIN